MLRKSAAVLTIVLCLANANATRAEPGPFVNLLMEAPVSMFDLGMLQLAIQLANLSENSYASFHPEYDWDKNRIYLWATITDAPPGTNVKYSCEGLIDKVRRAGSVFDGKAVMGV